MKHVWARSRLSSPVLGGPRTGKKRGPQTGRPAYIYIHTYRSVFIFIYIYRERERVREREREIYIYVFINKDVMIEGEMQHGNKDNNEKQRERKTH